MQNSLFKGPLTFLLLAVAAAAAAAQATWFEPGPWHASQATSISLQLVW